jgi:hypothetical protein
MRSNNSICYLSVDGADFKIEEPMHEPMNFDTKWYSHKFHGPGLRYEVGLCIQTGWMVWVNGPYPCGQWPDLRIARDWLVYELDPGEMFLADGGYRDGGVYAETPNGLNTFDQRMKSVARARHETVNARMKNWGVLRGTFRHHLTRHGPIFLAIANITQIQIEEENPLFQVDYHDNYE